MKKHTCVAFLILCFPFAVFAQEAVKILLSDPDYFTDVSTFELKPGLSDGLYAVYKDSLFLTPVCSGRIENGNKSGTWTWFHENGLKLREIPYLNGSINGTLISYYPTGEVSAMTEFADGVKNGSMTRWYKTGEVCLEAHYLNGYPSGTWKFLTTEGDLAREENY